MVDSDPTSRRSGPPYVSPPRIPWASAVVALGITGVLMAIMIRMAALDPILVTQFSTIPVGGGQGATIRQGIAGGTAEEDGLNLSALLDGDLALPQPSSRVVDLAQDLEQSDGVALAAFDLNLGLDKETLAEELRDRLASPAWTSGTDYDVPTPVLADAFDTAPPMADNEGDETSDDALLARANGARKGYVMARIRVEIDATGTAVDVLGDLLEHTHGSDDEGRLALLANIEKIKQWRFARSNATSDPTQTRTLEFIFVDADWSDVGWTRRTR